MAYNPDYIEDNKRNSSSGISSTAGILGGMAAIAGVSIAMPNAARTMAGGLGRFSAQTAGSTGRAVSYMAKRYGTQARQAGSFVKSLDHALEGQSPFALLFGYNQRMEQRFANSFEQSMNTINRSRATKFKGMSTGLEEGFMDHTRNLGGTASSMHLRSVQFASVMQRAKSHLPQSMHQSFETILTQQHDTFFSNPSVPRIDALLEKYTKTASAKANKQFSLDFGTDTEARTKFINSMFDTLNEFKDRKSIGLSNRGVMYGKTKDGQNRELDFGLKVQSMGDFSRKLTDDFLEKNKAKHDGFLNKMFGNTLTLRDALRYDEKNQKWVNHLFDNDSMKGVRYGGDVYDMKVGNKLAGQVNAAVRRGEDPNKWLDLAVDSKMFIKNGKITDLRSVDQGVYKSLSFVRETTQVPFLRFNPLDLMHWSTYQSVREAPSTYFFRRGTIHPWLGKNAQTTAHPSATNQDAVSGPLSKEYMFSNNKVYDVLTGEVVKDNMFLASARFGMIPRMAASMANLSRRDLRGRGVISKLFDIGGQETQNVWQRGASVFTKFADENWEPNTFRMMFNSQRAYGAGGAEFRESTYKNIYSYVNQHTGKLDDRTAEYLNRFVKQAYDDVNIDLSKLGSTEEVMSALGKLAKGLQDPSSGIVKAEGRGLDNAITSAWNQYAKNPKDFLSNKRIASDDSPFVIGSWQALDPYETTLVDKLDDVRRLIHQHAIEQVDQRSGLTVGQLVSRGIRNGELAKDAKDQVRGLGVLTQMQSYWDDVYRNGQSAKESALIDFFGDVRGGSNTGTKFGNDLFSEIKQHTNNFSAGPGDKPPQYFGLVGHTAMEKGRGYKWALQDYNERVANGEGQLTSLGKSAWGVLGQPFAGRGNMDQVTAGTIPFYYFAERLDNALAKVGLGLSQKNRGSMQSILANQFGRRIVLPYMAYEQLNYFDDQLGNEPSEFLADAYVKGHKGMAAIKEAIGLNAVGSYFSDLMPGVDQIGKIPVFAAAKHASFGLLGDNRSAEDLDYYYEHGEDPIRKGRWWGVGSNTPWEGGKIDRYQPNWYRRLKSNYQYTDTMYGSSDEYWGNHWMPTLTNPLAPLRHFVTDANHWEEKHRDDRPYPIQGGIAELQMIPLVGPALDNTLGRIVKPRVVRGDLEKQHRSYLEEINSYLESQYRANTQEGTLNVMPAGGYELMAGVGGTGGMGSAGLGYGGIDGGFGATLAINAGATAVDGTMIGGGGEITNMKSVSRAELASMNTQTASGGSAARAISSLDSLRDPDIKADLNDIGNPYGLKHSISGAGYSASEMAGIYGFTTRMLTGQTNEDPGLSLDQSTRMTSYNRAFWDAEMGGMGGDVSEIFRRFLPRDPNKTRYNPIRNTMPDWMPGVDYFVDFQHGDPYSKIAKGEMRLPGEAYQSLNDLHSDQFGEYGAFDRFKILADVAPYSNQYKFWRRQVSAMNTNGALDPLMQREYAEIRDQVSARKDKYHFYPYKFKYADINKEQVTVTAVLDAETFLTAEHPNNPIKLAGVQIPSDAENTKAWLYEHIHEGAKLTIGVDADPLFRVRDDSMNTIRAVVYSNGEKDLPFYLDQKGQSLNQIAISKNFGDKNKAKRASDNSAVATAAFYDKSEITVGKMWENVVHNLGKVPVVGTIFDKFVQVKSPLELYKKNEVYGKAWRPWYEPWSGWIQPMIQNAAEQNPLLAGAQGYGVGWLFGRNRMGKRWGSFIGATVMGGAAAVRSLDEMMGRTLPNMGGSDYTPIPERRKKEREINEYFDIIKYMKYKGLYEKTKILAKQNEGIDLDQIMGDSDVRGKRNKEDRAYLETMKKWLSIQEKLGYYDDDIIKEKLDKARSQLGQISGDRGSYQLGQYSMQAMQYRAEYESTLYGADEDGDMTKIYRGLPSKDREFFQHFMNATPDEREEILRVVPKDQRRFYQAKWGLKRDKKTDLGAYFLNHNLPGAGWEGWNPNVSLESIKLKVVKNEGLELTEFGMWDDDVKRAAQEDVPEINPFRPSMAIDPLRIQKILRGAGLNDVNVTMQVGPSKGENKLSVAMDVVKDRSQELISAINADLGSLI